MLLSRLGITYLPSTLLSCLALEWRLLSRLFLCGKLYIFSQQLDTEGRVVYRTKSDKGVDAFCAYYHIIIMLLQAFAK